MLILQALWGVAVLALLVWIAWGLKCIYDRLMHFENERRYRDMDAWRWAHRYEDGEVPPLPTEENRRRAEGGDIP